MKLSARLRLLVAGLLVIHATAALAADFAAAPVSFEKQVLTERFVAEGCALADFDRDGRPDLAAGNSIWYGPEFTRRIDFTPPANNPAGMTKTPYDPARGYSDFFLMFAHDFTGDSWPDILVYGLPGGPAHVYVNPAQQRPAADAASPLWPFHPGPFGPEGARGGGQMYVYDVNGDGRNDVIASHDGHGFGLGWFEQRPDGGFTEHRIMGSTAADHPHGVAFSQVHALRLADFDGDGLLDILTGKRRWAHGINGDPEPNAPPVLYWFRLTRDGKGGATYEPQRIDDDSGVGTQVTAGDVTGDGKPDVAVANKRGVFIFRQK